MRKWKGKATHQKKAVKATNWLLSCSRHLILQGLLLFLFSNTNAQPAIVIHGGAGTISRKSLTPELDRIYRATLDSSLKAGYKILLNGGSSVDAVEASLKLLEDSPLFNAGKGSVLNSEGFAEMDASIMSGKDLKAGAVAVTRHIKNPIAAARVVMENSPHVMLSGKGAETYVQSRGVMLVDSTYFIIEQRTRQLDKVKRILELKKSDTTGFIFTDEKFGTVGAVALDIHGNLAAATSTGGMTNKRFGRIGDSPVIGAGTYANNKTCAVSCTGHGEYFIRAVAAHDVSAMMEHGQRSLTESMKHVVHSKLKSMGGEGGMIGIDAQGNIAMEFNSEGMYRGFMNKDGCKVFIYKDDN